MATKQRVDKITGTESISFKEVLLCSAEICSTWSSTSKPVIQVFSKSGNTFQSYYFMNDLLCTCIHFYNVVVLMTLSFCPPVCVPIIYSKLEIAFLIHIAQLACVFVFLHQDRCFTPSLFPTLAARRLLWSNCVTTQSEHMQLLSATEQRVGFNRVSLSWREFSSWKRKGPERRGWSGVSNTHACAHAHFLWRRCFWLNRAMRWVMT